MADTTELRQPGIEVLQVIRTVSPTVFTPTLRACPVGPCWQVVEVIEQDSTGTNVLNADAVLASPAAWEATVAGPYNLDAHVINVEVNNNAAVAVTFTGTSISAAAAATTINTALEAANLSDQAYAEAVDYGSTTVKYLRIRTRAGGASQIITLSCSAADYAHIGTYAPAANAFGNFYNYRSYRGGSQYSNNTVSWPRDGYPDPLGNIADLELDTSSVRAFVYLGTGVQVQEAMTTQSFLRHGIVAATYLVSAIAPVDDGDGDATTPIIRFTGENFTTDSAVITFAGDSDIVAVQATLAGKTLTFDFGLGDQTVSIVSGVAANIITGLNNAFGDHLVFSLGGGNVLTVTTVNKGTEAKVKLTGGTGVGGANTLSGLHAFLNVEAIGDRATVGATIETTAHRPLVGDDVYINGGYVGRIVQVAPGAVVTDLKLDTEYSTSTTGWVDYYIVARNLPAPSALTGKRPVIDFLVDATKKSSMVKFGLMRDTTGSLIPVSQQLYCSYKALRKDVTVRSSSKPSLLTFDSTTQLESLLSPVTTDNPLALAARFSLLNAPSTQVACFGVDAVSTDQPEGTTEAYTRALEFLESKEVWGIVPLTRDIEVAQVALVHADGMSEAENKGERVILFSLDFPTRAMDTLVSSGTNGNTATSVPKKFDTGAANLPALLLAADIDPTIAIPVADGVFLDIEGDANHYSVSAVSGSVLTLRTLAASFAAGENDDGFYFTDGGAGIVQQIGTAFALKVRGAELVDTNGDPDYDAIAGAYQDYARSFGSRRFWHLQLDTVEAAVGGITQALPGYYYCAAYAGAISANLPQQSFTNFPITGFTKVTGTNDTFTTRQMNRMAAGGNTIVIQDPPETGPIFARMALTTNTLSIETRTDSITKILDYTAKFVRTGLRNFIGRYNITQNYLDMLSHILQGQTEFLMGAGTWTTLEVNNLIQDRLQPDTVTVDLLGDPPYPSNYIRVSVII